MNAKLRIEQQLKHSWWLGNIFVCLYLRGEMSDHVYGYGNNPQEGWRVEDVGMVEIIKFLLQRQEQVFQTLVEEGVALPSDTAAKNKKIYITLCITTWHIQSQLSVQREREKLKDRELNVDIWIPH